MNFFKKNWGLIAILLLSYWAIKPLLVPGFFPIHDNEQIGRLFDLNQALSFGEIPPRIAPNLGFGYGYLFFNFYPPLAYYIAEIFKIIGFSYIVSTKLMIGLGFLLGSFFMYLFSKEFFGKIGGIISAIFYTYAPYHAVDAYVRGALPEFWSMVFLPAIFWAIYKYRQTPRWQHFIFSIIFMSFLILVHNLVFVMAAPFIFAWIIFLSWDNKNKKKFLLGSLAILTMALLTTAYFWAPSFFEKQYTMVNLLTKELANYEQHFVCPLQFWNSPWGYGGSVTGCIDGMSFQIGKAQMLLSILAFFLAIKLFIAKKTKKLGIIIFLLTAFLLFSIFMATSYSDLIWNRINFLWYIQFPWRFLIFCSFFSSFLAGAIALIPLPKKIMLTLAAIIIFILISKSAKYFTPSKFFSYVTDRDYISQDVIRWDTSIISWEYVPRGIVTKKSDMDTTIIDINKDEIAKSSFRVLTGDMRIETIKNYPQEKEFFVFASEKSILRINSFSYPGWKVFVDGQEVSYADNNKLKLITLKPLVGKHNILVKFTDTKVRFLSNLVSFVSIITLIIFSLSRIIRFKPVLKAKPDL